jgi:uncharacterized protein (DUF2236 family)
MPLILSAPLRRLISGDDAGHTEYVLAMREPGDAGLFGPASVSWRILAYPATLLGGVRALLLQSLDPLTVAGVARHSRFRSEPIGRLQATARFVTIAAFGSTEQVAAECAMIRRVHERVKGTTPDGRAYSASDPKQLLFVHMALVQSFLVAHREFAPGGLTIVDADRFVEEWNALAPLLGFDSVPLPHTADELDRMLEEYGSGFRAGPDALEALEFLASPPLPPAMRPGYRLLLTAAAGSLPAYARALLPDVLPSPSPVVTSFTGSAIVRALAAVLGPSPAHQAALERLGLTES